MEASKSIFLPKIIMYSLGLLLCAMGMITFLYPQIMVRYGFSTDSIHAVMSIRSLIGGAEIGLGVLMLFGNKINMSVQSRLWVLLFLFLGVLIARIISIVLIGGPVPQMIWRELIAEMFIVLAVFWSLKCITSTRSI